MNRPIEDAIRGFRWGLAQRIAFIDFRLYWEGRINRSDIIDFFGISPQQASADLQEYFRFAADSVEYDKSAKSYRARGNFKPTFVSGQPNDYLEQLLLQDTGPRGQAASYIGVAPVFAALPRLQRRIAAPIFKAILTALRERLAIEVQYQSMKSPDPEWRWVSPHALGFDGLRWHVRAYSHKNEKFRDFVLARILETRGTDESSADPSKDEDWHQNITVRIGPHPQLSIPQRKAIERDYDMENGEKAFEVKAALAFYLLQRLGLDRDSEAKPAEARQIVLLNSNELDRYRGAVRNQNSHNLR